MNDKESLLEAIRLEPQNKTPKLVYADWLDENGQCGLAMRWAAKMGRWPLSMGTSHCWNYKRKSRQSMCVTLQMLYTSFITVEINKLCSVVESSSAFILDRGWWFKDHTNCWDWFVSIFDNTYSAISESGRLKTRGYREKLARAGIDKRQRFV